MIISKSSAIVYSDSQCTGYREGEFLSASNIYTKTSTL